MPPKGRGSGADDLQYPPQAASTRVDGTGRRSCQSCWCPVGRGRCWVDTAPPKLLAVRSTPEGPVASHVKTQSASHLLSETQPCGPVSRTDSNARTPRRQRVLTAKSLVTKPQGANGLTLLLEDRPARPRHPQSEGQGGGCDRVIVCASEGQHFYRRTLPGPSPARAVAPAAAVLPVTLPSLLQAAFLRRAGWTAPRPTRPVSSRWAGGGSARAGRLRAARHCPSPRQPLHLSHAALSACHCLSPSADRSSPVSAGRGAPRRNLFLVDQILRNGLGIH